MVCVVALGVWSNAAAAPEPDDGIVLRVSYGSRALYPGDIALLAVTASSPLAAVEGSAFGRPIRFWRSDIAGQWHGFVGVGLETTPGAYEVAIRATGAGTEIGARRLSLPVQPKRFETRQLRVSERFANPPAAEGQRIEREARLLATLFSETATDRLWRGSFEPPVPGRATSSFGRLTLLNGEPRGRHQGADFAARVGTPVRAPNAGRVVLATDLYFSGNTVVLDHGAGLFSLFAHLSRIAVSAGALAAGGELLGEAGATGRVTGPHLHWAVRLGDLSVDPVSLMQAVTDVAGTPSSLTAR